MASSSSIIRSTTLLSSPRPLTPAAACYPARAAASADTARPGGMTTTAEAQAQEVVVVGAGRVGQALVAMGSGRDVLLRRGQRVPEDAPAGPILVCTRNDDLDAVVDATPEARRPGACRLCVPSLV